MAEAQAGHSSANPQLKATIRTALVYLLGAVLLLFIWFQRRFLLLTFAGLLFAVFLRTITGWIERVTRLSSMFSYFITLVLLGCLAAGVGFFIVPHLSSRLSQISESLPQSMHRLEQPLLQRPWGRDLIGEVKKIRAQAGVGSELPKMASAVMDGVVDIILILAIGFFAALNPRGYREGTLILIPESRRAKLRHLFQTLRRQLRWWLFGQMFAMLVLGVGCSIGLWILGVQLHWTLGLITGIAVFVPYVGTVAAGVPAVLMGLQKSPATAIYVLIFYTVLHVVEGYLLTPFIQKRAVRLPPALTLLSQFLMWNIAGVLGVAMAAPLTSTVLALVKESYLHVPPEKEIV